MTIVRGKTKPAGLRIVIYGPAGVGKTTLASKFPDSLFFDYENGTHGIDVAKVETAELPQSYETFIGSMKELKRDHMGFKNIVIDSADALEETFDKTVSKKKNIPSVFAVDDYFRTQKEHERRFGDCLDEISGLVDSGMNVIFVAHKQIRKAEPLENNNGKSYDYSDLQISKKCSESMKQWADVIIYCDFKTFLVEGEKKGDKAHAGGGKRWCFCGYSPEWESKHRQSVDLPEDCSLDKMSEILPKIIAESTDPSNAKVSASKTSDKSEEEAKAALAKKREAKAAEEAAAKPASDAQPENKEPAPASAPAEQKSDRGIVNEFRTLLRQYEMKEEGIVKYADRKFQERYGKHSSEVPVDEWPDDFIGWLIRGISNGKITPEKVNN